jgi:hypothetical protein
MSDYLHGDLTMHAIYRKMTYLMGNLNIPDDASPEDVMRMLKGFRPSMISEG